MTRFLSLTVAVAENLSDRDTVAFEGFSYLVPSATAHDASRQGRRNLTLIRMVPDLAGDKMIGMDMVLRLVFAYGGNPGIGRTKPAGGGAPEIAISAREIFITLAQPLRAHCEGPISLPPSATAPAAMRAGSSASGRGGRPYSSPILPSGDRIPRRRRSKSLQSVPEPLEPSLEELHALRRLVARAALATEGRGR